jgi:hypothetical protein
MTTLPLHKGLYGQPAPYPQACEPLEEVAAARPADAAATFAFALARLMTAPAARPLVLVTTAAWLRERGRPFARGLTAWAAGPERLIWVRADKEDQALWALEEALKSGAGAAGARRAGGRPQRRAPALAHRRPGLGRGGIRRRRARRGAAAGRVGASARRASWRLGSGAG